MAADIDYLKLAQDTANSVFRNPQFATAAALVFERTIRSVCGEKDREIARLREDLRVANMQSACLNIRA